MAMAVQAWAAGAAASDPAATSTAARATPAKRGSRHEESTPARRGSRLERATPARVAVAMKESTPAKRGSRHEEPVPTRRDPGRSRPAARSAAERRRRQRAKPGRQPKMAAADGRASGSRRRRWPLMQDDPVIVSLAMPHCRHIVNRVARPCQYIRSRNRSIVLNRKPNPFPAPCHGRLPLAWQSAMKSRLLPAWQSP